MEPESVWQAILLPLGPWKITVESVLAQNYCDVGSLGRCTQHAALTDLLERHVVKRAPAANGLNKFPHVPDPDGLREEFHRIANTDPGIAKADVLMCSEPPFFCELFLGLGKAIFGYVGNPWGAYLPPGGHQEDFYEKFYGQLVGDSRNTFACLSPYLSALIYWHSGARVPAVRPLGLYTRATYRPAVGDVLITKQIFSFWDPACVLNDFASALVEAEIAAGVSPRNRRYNGTRFVRLKDLKDRSWTNWARHRAAVVLPYDPQQMVFYELYGMGVPLLVPSTDLLPLMTRLGFTNIQDFAYQRPGWEVQAEELAYDWSERAALWELRWWSSLTDFVRAPHLLRWRSAPELLRKLLHTDLTEVAARMRRFTEVQLVSAADFWRGAFARALAPN